MRLRLLVALTLAMATVTAPRPLLAQDAASVRGTVRRAADNSPVHGVTVIVQGTGIATVTATDGRYVLTRVPAGEQTLVFRFIGFAPERHVVKVSVGGGATVDVSLTLQPVKLSEVVVSSASKVPERIVDAPAAISSVDPTLLRNLAPSGQMPLALANVPGVDIVQGGMNQFDVNARGMTTTFNRRLLVLQDGRDVADVLPGSPFEWNAMSIPLDESSRMELVRGPGSALYGANAFNGVVDIHTAAPRDIQGTRLSLTGSELSSVQADLRNAGVFGNGSFGYRVNLGYRQSNDWALSRTSIDSLDLRREYAGATDYPVAKGRDTRPLNGQSLGAGSTAAGQADPLRGTYGSARLDWYGSSGVVATVEAGLSRVENELYASGSGRFQRTGIDRPWARLNLGSDNFNLMAWYSGDKSLQPYYNIAAGRAFEQNAGATHVEGQFNRSFSGDRTRIVAGASYRNSKLYTNSTYLATADDDRSDDTWAVFGQMEHRLSSVLKVVAAARWDQGNLFSSEISPKVALVYTPTDGQVFRVTLNRAFRTPSPIERFTQSTNAASQTTPATLETGLNGYFGTVSAAVTAASIPATVTTGLNVGMLPWNFDALTPSTNRGNRHLDVERVTGWEVGYKGGVGSWGFVTVDLYRNDLTNFVTAALAGGVNPDYPRFFLDSGRTFGMLATLDSLDARLPAAGRAPGDPLRAPIPGLRTSLNAFNASVHMPRLVTLPSGKRALVQSFTNAGEVIAQGVDVGVSAVLTQSLRLDGSVSYFDFTVLDVKVGDKLPANTPRWKGTLGLAYTTARADASLSARFVDVFDWSTGVWVGPVPSSLTVTFAGGYRINPRLRLHAIVTNLLDQRRFQSYGGSVLGRRAMLGITTDF